MRLKAIFLENFRGYSDPTLIPINDLTAFIGRNDIGKSTILEALEIFFNGDIVKIDSYDATINSDASHVVIGCIFDELPDEMILDTTAETTLADEYLLNENGDLEIHKVFDCTKKTKITPQVYAVAYHPTAKGRDGLLLLKQAELKKRCNELGVNVADLDLRVNAQLRKAIWENCSRGDLDLKTVQIQLDKDDAKQIWDRISDYLPLYALFQSDRSSSDGDSEVQDPMKIAIKQAIAKVQSQIDEIKQIVEKEITDVAQRTLEKLSEMNPDLAKSLTPSLTTEPKWEGFGLTLKGDDDIPMNKRGSGIRRLILLNFFRAEAERKAQANTKQSVIYAIEEPETSQHPNNQKMLIKALLDLSENPNCQVLITTHVPALAGMIPIDCLRYLDRVNDKVTIEYGTVSTNTAVFEKIANTIGILPSPNQPKVIFCVEGMHDINFWYVISRMLHQHDSDLPDLSRDRRIVTVAVGGGNLKHWIDYNYLGNFRIPEVHIYDSDLSADYQQHCNKVNARNDGSWATLTSKRTIENYLHPDAIREVLGTNINFNDFDDVPMMVAESHANPNAWARSDSKFKKKKAHEQKLKLNREVTEKMTYLRLQMSDPNSEIIGWLQKLASYL